MRFLYDIPTPVITASLLVVMVASIEGAQRLGYRFERDRWPHARDMFVATSAAMLALLGLLLAFSFNMSAERYDERKTLVLKEAESISNVYMRADLLVPEAREQVRSLLWEYAELRVAYFDVGHNEARESIVIADAKAVQRRIWSLVAAADNYLEPRTIGMSLLASATGDMIAVLGERHASRANRVPEPVLWMLFMLATLSAAAVGYSFGASQHKSRLFTFTFAFLVCMVVHVILDLDRPRRGLMTLDQTPMRELRSTLQ